MEKRKVEVVVLITLLSIFFNLRCAAQENLIRNGSFEIFKECPITGFDFPASDWHVLKGTPDLFASCVPTGGETGVPYNYSGTREAIDGYAYAGIFLIMHSPTIKNGYKLEESIYDKMIKNMEKGKRYKVSFFISLSDSSCFFTDSIYCSFSNELPVQAKPIKNMTGSWNYFEKVDNYAININFPSKKKWNLVEMEFIAANNYTYFSIGLPRVSYTEKHYNLDLLNSTKALGTNRKEMSSYYYIDNISLVEIK